MAEKTTTTIATNKTIIDGYVRQTTQTCYCTYKRKTCEYANLNGYCMLTACVKEFGDDR